MDSDQGLSIYVLEVTDNNFKDICGILNYSLALVIPAHLPGREGLIPCSLVPFKHLLKPGDTSFRFRISVK